MDQPFIDDHDFFALLAKSGGGGNGGGNGGNGGGNGGMADGDGSGDMGGQVETAGRTIFGGGGPLAHRRKPKKRCTKVGKDGKLKVVDCARARKSAFDDGNDFFKAFFLGGSGQLMKAGPSKVTFSGHKLQGKRKFNGMDLSIENRAGSVRKGTDPDGKEWRTEMKIPYGYIRETIGQDKDHLDCFVGPDRSSPVCFVVKQVKPDTGKFDEDKVMLGFTDEARAKKAYLQHYDTPRYFGSIKRMTVDKLKERAIKNKEKNL